MASAVQVAEAQRTCELGVTEFLIDDSGEIWPVESETLARRFGWQNPRKFVFRAVDLGIIFVRFGNCGAQIALRPHFFSRSAVSRLFDIICQRNPARVALARHARLSSWEILCDAERAIARIEQLIAEAQNSLSRPLITTERLAVERCLDIARGQLLPVLQAWHQRQGRWETDLYGRLLDWKLLPHTIITEQPKSSERLLLRHWGARVLTYGQDWPRIAPGHDCEDQPNAEVAGGVPRYYGKKSPRGSRGSRRRMPCSGGSTISWCGRQTRGWYCLGGGLTGRYTLRRSRLDVAWSSWSGRTPLLVEATSGSVEVGAMSGVVPSGVK